MNNIKFYESSDYWEKRYSNNSDTWTLNKVNPVFVRIIEEKKFGTINDLLIIGCGKGYEACFAAQSNIRVTAVDFSIKALTSAEEDCKLKNGNPKFINMNLFELKKWGEKFDSVYEYTTFCSLNPDKIEELLWNIESVLKTNGIFITVLFPLREVKYKPPIPIDLKNFVQQAKKMFNLIYMQKNINSIKPRQGNELLLIFRKKRN
jgi:cyclopropane fatty-acyl-phospholipid synthase-like methyltransferase